MLLKIYIMFCPPRGAKKKGISSWTISFPSNSASLFGVMKHKSSAIFLIKRYILCTKRTNQSGNFENFESSGQNSSNYCHFWNNKSVFLWILHQPSVSWDINPLYFIRWNFIYFQQKKPIKVQIWWKFTWAVKSLKFCTLMGSFYPNHIKFQPKKYRRVISHDTEEWCKVYRKTDLWFQIWHEEFGEFSLNHSKVWKFLVDGLILSKVYKVLVTKMQRSYLSWHWTVMQNLNKPWPCGFKNGMRNWMNFH